MTPTTHTGMQQVEELRCYHYVTSAELGSKRLELRRVSAADPHTALCWLVARGFEVADQLDRDAAPAVIKAVQDAVMHAELLAALESGYGYGLPLPIGEETHTFEVRQPRRAAVVQQAPETPAGLALWHRKDSRSDGVHVAGRTATLAPCGAAESACPPGRVGAVQSGAEAGP